MVEITTMRIWIGITLAWLLFWMLVFDRWFFLSPLGLMIALGIPIAGWVIWHRFYRDREQEILADSRLVLGRGADILQRFRRQLSNHR